MVFHFRVKNKKNLPIYRLKLLDGVERKQRFSLKFAWKQTIREISKRLLLCVAVSFLLIFIFYYVLA